MGAPQITIAGLGPAGLDLLSAQALEVLSGESRLLLRTARHPAAAELQERGVRFEALDGIYDESASFEGLYPRLAAAVLAAAEAGPVVYAVPGHPLVGEESVRLLLQQAAIRGLGVRVLPAPGFLDVVLPALAAAGEIPDLTEWQVADGAALERVWWDPRRPVLVFQVDDAAAASRVKLALLEEYPDDHPVCVVRRAGQRDRETLRRLALYDLDRPEAGEYDHLSTIYVPPVPPERQRPGFQDFVEVIARLRAPDGCPWDREQNYHTLSRYSVEEVYEVLEAIESEDPQRLCEELGDLMIQVLMLAQFGREDGYFDIRDVIVETVEKLVRRHPHVFGDATVEDAEEVRKHWDEIKRGEKPERVSVLDGVPKTLPALMKAHEVSKRVVRVGFEWANFEAVLAELDEEVAELNAELERRDPDRLADEIGDILFTVVNVARWLKLDPEESLRRMIDRFARRFREVERLAVVEGLVLGEIDARELDRLWTRAKRAIP